MSDTVPTPPERARLTEVERKHGELHDELAAEFTDRMVAEARAEAAEQKLGEAEKSMLLAADGIAGVIGTLCNLPVDRSPRGGGRKLIGEEARLGEIADQLRQGRVYDDEWEALEARAEAVERERDEWKRHAEGFHQAGSEALSRVEAAETALRVAEEALEPGPVPYMRVIVEDRKHEALAGRIAHLEQQRDMALAALKRARTTTTEEVPMPDAVPLARLSEVEADRDRWQAWAETGDGAARSENEARLTAERRAEAAERRLREAEEVLIEGWGAEYPEDCIPLALAVVRGNETTTTEEVPHA